MALTDEFVCPAVRFKFWNGVKTYTVERCPSIRTWFIFDEEMRDNCLAKFEVDRHKYDDIDLKTAKEYLDKYFQSINSEYYTV